MPNLNFLLIGILMGTFPTLQSPVIPLNRKMVPAIFSFLIMAFLDWSDGCIILFLSTAVVINWVYQRDVLNLFVDKMMLMMVVSKDKMIQMMNNAKDKITQKIRKIISIDDQSRGRD